MRCWFEYALAPSLVGCERRLRLLASPEGGVAPFFSTSVIVGCKVRVEMVVGEMEGGR